MARREKELDEKRILRPVHYRYRNIMSCTGVLRGLAVMPCYIEGERFSLLFRQADSLLFFSFWISSIEHKCFADELNEVAIGCL